ncbi:Protein disulfide-isomerase [Escovopsis weberi]|uniref:Protein disulfide-isomerase n=1 Tax=Escovopsis weberi TaxID=150374 RepID=A0A0M8N6F9_ESCWE|nr:Protein disulfide-isomerase [Escovopsis weberi]
MHHKHITAGLVAALATVVLGDSDVTQLTKDTFNNWVESNPLALVEFFAPWCGHCKALAPEYEEAATTLKEKSIGLAKVDCTEETDLCKEYGVEGYPTLKVMRGLEDVKPYLGARKADAISAYMVKQSLPAVSTLTKETHDEFKDSDHVVIIAYVNADDKASSESFHGVGNELREKFFFGISDDAAIAKAEGVEAPAIVLYKDFDERKAVYTGKFESDDIMSFIQTAATPEVGEVGPETYSAYMSTKKPLAYIFAETAEERKELAELLKPLARKYKEKINVATIDAKTYGGHAANINLQTDKFPAFAIQDVANNLKFPFSQELTITFDAISEFVDSFIAGTLEPSVKSEPIPEKQDGPVTVVVGKTFNEVVIDNEQDVLIEFYAPWCGHCKALAPKWDELGALYAESEHKKNVVIAKVDATANDLPIDIKGFPSLFLYAAGDKKNPIEYEGSRSVEDFVKFISEKGKYKASVVVPEPVPEPTQAAEEKKEKAEEKKAEKEEEKKEAEEEEKESHDEL